MATIKDVAQLAGVSVCTVSRTLADKGYVKDETRQRVMAAVAELNYRPNRVAVNLKTGKNDTLALVIPSLTNIYYPKLEMYLEYYAKESGYVVYLCNAENSSQKERSILKMLYAQNPAGVIITPCTSEHGHIMKLQEYGIPYVYLNRSFDDDLEHCIHFDNEKAAYQSVSYLIENGHTNIAGLYESFDNMTYRERYDGTVRALEEHGLPVNLDRFLFDLDPNDVDGTFLAARGLLERPDRPEAIFACNDMTAFHVYKAAYDLGLRIPDDLSIVGYDDCIMASMVAPPLSSYEPPARELSRIAVQFIDHFRRTGTSMEMPALDGQLIIRNSVKRIIDG